MSGDKRPYSSNDDDDDDDDDDDVGNAGNSPRAGSAVSEEGSNDA